MSFASPLALFALLAVPAIVALHHFRSQLPERRVSALFLFPVAAAPSDGGRRRRPLVRSPSLWLECLAAVLAALWLAGPSLAAFADRHVVLVVDHGASMGSQATAAAARLVLMRELDGLGRSDRLTVVATGAVPTVVVGPRASGEQGRAWLEGFVPRSPSHALGPALGLARELASADGELVLVTDARPVDAVPDVRVVACGVPQANAALAAVRRDAVPGGERLTLTAVAFGSVPAGELIVSDEARELLRMPLAMPPDGDLQLAVPLPQGTGAVRVTLPGDGLAIDDEAWCLPAVDRVVAVCDQLPAARREALALDRVFEVLDGFRAEPDAARAQVVLRGSPGPDPWRHVEIVLGASDGPALGHRGPFVLDRTHPLLQGVTLDGVAWQSGGGDPPGRVLVAAGGKALVTEQRFGEGRRVHVDVDGALGNVVRSPDWPILLANALELGRRLAPGFAAAAVRVGEPIVLHAPQGAQAALFGPDGRELVRGVGDLVVVAEQPGRHVARLADGRELASCAVAFVDFGESDLRAAATFEAAPEAPTAGTSRADGGALGPWLGLLLVCAVLLDWWWLGGRGR